MWRFRGTPHYLKAQGERLGLSRLVTGQAAHNREMHRVSTLVGQLSERYHQLAGCAIPLGPAELPPAEIARITGTLAQCERELEKLHALAAAAQDIIDEAHRAFGLEPPERSFRVGCECDSGVASGKWQVAGKGASR